MTAALHELLSVIPALDEAEFTQLVDAVFLRMRSQYGTVPLSEEQWAEKLDHSIAQAKQGQKSEAGTLTARIRSIYG